MSKNQKVRKILESLYEETIRVRKSPTEQNYLIAERKIEQAAKSGRYWPKKITLSGWIISFLIIYFSFSNGGYWISLLSRGNFFRQSTPPPQAIHPIQDSNSPNMAHIKFPVFAALFGETTGSQINVRSSPSVEPTSLHYGLVGDKVSILQDTKGADGNVWYLVEFPSHAQGWIRGDFIKIMY